MYSPIENQNERATCLCYSLSLRLLTIAVWVAAGLFGFFTAAHYIKKATIASDRVAPERICRELNFSLCFNKSVAYMLVESACVSLTLNPTPIRASTKAIHKSIRRGYPKEDTCTEVKAVNAKQVQ